MLLLIWAGGGADKTLIELFCVFWATSCTFNLSWIPGMSAGGGVWFLHSQLGVLRFPPNAKEVVDLISTISYFREEYLL